MKTALLTATLIASSPTLARSQTTVWSQSTDNTTIVAGSASCQSPGGITDNSYWRKYDPVDCGVTGDYEITSCTFAVEDADTTSGMQNILVNIRDSSAGFPVGASMAPILGSGTIAVVDTDFTMQTFETVVFNPPISVPAGTCVAVEVKAFNGMPQGDFFFIGSNGHGETPPDSSYISAADCGILDPVPYSAVGFPGVHVIIDLECDSEPLDPTTPYCEANINSSGQAARIFGEGSPLVTDNDLTLTVVDLPPNQFGYFLMSSIQAFVPLFGGSQGNLCLGLPIFRFSADVQSSGPAGEFAFQPDLTALPQGIVFQPGDTWNFQCWFRDINPQFTSNTSNGLAITFATNGDPSVQFPVVLGEVDEMATQLEVQVTLSQSTNQAVSVPFAESGTATPHVDYRVESLNPLVIPAGETSGTLFVTIAHDTDQEPDETVVITLQQPQNGVLGTQIEHTLTIVDND